MSWCCGLNCCPTILEGRPRTQSRGRLQKRLERWLPVIVAVGILLPTMHQSSLGTLMIIAGQKLSPLWQTSLLPLLFPAVGHYHGLCRDRL